MWALRHEAAHSVDILTWISSPSGSAKAPIGGMKTHEKTTEHSALKKTKHQFLYLRSPMSSMSFHVISCYFSFVGSWSPGKFGFVCMPGSFWFLVPFQALIAGWGTIDEHCTQSFGSITALASEVRKKRHLAELLLVGHHFIQQILRLDNVLREGDTYIDGNSACSQDDWTHGL